MARPPLSTASRERILQEAEHLIHLQGYRCTSLDKIAKCCRMTKANLLHHFHSKQTLGLAVLDYKISAYRCTTLEAVFGTNRDPLEAVAEIFESAGRFHRNNGCRAGCFVGNIALEMSDEDERFRRRASEFFTDWAARLENLLDCSKKRGELSASLDSKAWAETVLALYEGTVMLAKTRRDPKIFRRVGRIATELLRGCARSKNKRKGG